MFMPLLLQDGLWGAYSRMTLRRHLGAALADYSTSITHLERDTPVSMTRPTTSSTLSFCEGDSALSITVFFVAAPGGFSRRNKIRTSTSMNFHTRTVLGCQSFTCNFEKICSVYDFPQCSSLGETGSTVGRACYLWGGPRSLQLCSLHILRTFFRVPVPFKGS